MLPLKPPYSILHFINILSPNICTFWDVYPFLHSYPIFSILSNWNHLTKRTQNSNFPKSFLAHCPQPKLNQRSPKLICILTIKHWPKNRCTHTFGGHCLQVLWFQSLPFRPPFQKAPFNGATSSNHLKRKLQTLKTRARISTFARAVLTDPGAKTTIFLSSPREMCRSWLSCHEIVRCCGWRLGCATAQFGFQQQNQFTQGIFQFLPWKRNKNLGTVGMQVKSDEKWAGTDLCLFYVFRQHG